MINLEKITNNIQTRDDFLEFMEIINGYKNYKDGKSFAGEKFKNKNLIPFYEGILDYLTPPENNNLKNEITNDSDEITWKLLAKMIVAGMNNY